jgi:hypothetical protein
MFLKSADIDGGRSSIFAGAFGASRFLMLMKFEVRFRESVDGDVSVDMFVGSIEKLNGPRAH